MAEAPVVVWLDQAGTLLRLRLARPRANVLDGAMIGALDDALGRHDGYPGLKAVLIDAEGPHFSYGASVEEHLPERCAAMLRAMHGLVRRVAAYPVPVLFAVRGQCLGGALELATAGHLIFAGRDAQLGQPEIRLGVFAPAASCLLPARIGRMAAEELLLSGRIVAAEEARAIGLVAGVSYEPEGAALDFFVRHLAPQSASSLRYAVAAARGEFCRRLEAELAAVERLYLEGVMSTRDATEGISAFLAKRPALWQNR